MTGNGERECGTAKAHTIKNFRIGKPSVEVTQTQRDSLTCYDDGGRSETITPLRLYSPNRLFNRNKYYESNGIKILERLSWLHKSTRQEPI